MGLYTTILISPKLALPPIPECPLNLSSLEYQTKDLWDDLSAYTLNEKKELINSDGIILAPQPRHFQFYTFESDTTFDYWIEYEFTRGGDGVVIDLIKFEKTPNAERLADAAERDAVWSNHMIRMSKWYMKPYKVYRSAIVSIGAFVRRNLTRVYDFTWKIERFLTPL